MEVKTIVTENYLAFEHDMPVSQVASKLQDAEKHAGIVFKNNKYIGVVEKRRLVKARVNPTEAKVEKYVQKAPLVDEQTSLIEAARLLVGSEVDHLPVEKEKEIVGVVSMSDLAVASIELPEAKNLTVNDIKFLKSTKVNKDEHLTTAIELMQRDHVDHLPVFKNGALYGVLSYKDIIRKHLNWNPRRDVSTKFNSETRTKAAKGDFPALNLPVHGFSTNDNLVSVPGKFPVKDAVNEMISHKISSVLVMDGNEYKGLLSTRNILEKVSSLQQAQNYTVQFVGLQKAMLSEHQESSIHSIVEKEATRMQRKIEDPFTVTVHLKEARKDGKQQLFEVHLKITWPGKVLTSTKENWDVETALHKCFNHVRSALER